MQSPKVEQTLGKAPGFRRRFRITPMQQQVRCEVEDDFHCMAVTVEHDGEVATAIEPSMQRAPWTTCPGAIEQLKTAFVGVALTAFPLQGSSHKQQNCTHLYDLALLAANHAFDSDKSVYDIFVSDPIGGERTAELHTKGAVILSWTESDFKIVLPEEMAGILLFNMREWIDALPPQQQEMARLLRWANMIANGRTIPIEQQSDATQMPPNCYTFQPQRAPTAKRVGEIVDFSDGLRQPLDNCGENH